MILMVLYLIFSNSPMNEFTDLISILFGLDQIIILFPHYEYRKSYQQS